MKKKTVMHGAMAELLSKSNEAQIKDKEPSSVRVQERRIAESKTPGIKNTAQNAQQPAQREPMKAPLKAQQMQQTQQMPQVRNAQQAPAAQPAPKNPPVMQNPQMMQTAAVRVQTQVKTQPAAPISKPQSSEAVPARNTPVRKRRKAKKSIWKKALGYAAAAVVIVAGAAAALIMTADKEGIIVPEAHIGAPVKVSANAAEFSSKASDDKKHDGRNYVTIDIFEGEELVCSTGASTVGKVLEDMNVKIEGDYVLRENESDSITSDKVISIDKITYGTITEQSSVPYDTKYVDVQTIARGKTKLVRAGANGVSTATYKVTYVNGVESERVLESQIITTQPTSQIVNRGVGGTITIGGKTYSYSYYIDCKTTVYTGGGITASGLPATEKVIAVDPRVIPLGTSVYVADSYCYVGFRTAADTGGVIKGNFIDIYMDEDNPYLWGYGVRSARVYILD